MNPRACLKRRSEIALFNAAILELSFYRAGGVVWFEFSGISDMKLP